ncbi:MAG: OmpA family protein [Candidatus Cloacimonetes bacterium]|nr:OmpA family protein [Candidatus Cloacimonadota bacterium]
MPRKKKCPECPPAGSPAWMATFCDMSTLLLTFFVLLMSMATIEQVKFTLAMNSLRGALGIMSATGTAIPITRMPLVQIGTARAEQEIEQQLQELQEMLRSGGISDDIRVHQSSDVLHFTISENYLFDSGSAEVKQEAYEVLGIIARILNTVSFNVRIEGHTDNIPIHTVRFPSNWELSFARSLSISQRFATNGVDPSRFQLVGHGEFRPIADNSTPQGRAINRRVEIFVTLRDEIRSSLMPGG